MRSLKNQCDLPDGGLAFHASDRWLDLIAIALRDHDFPSSAQCVNMRWRVIAGEMPIHTKLAADTGLKLD